MRKTTLLAATLAVMGIAAYANTASAAVLFDATLAPPGFYNGTGNPSNNFTTDTTADIETGLRARFRGGPNVTPVGDVYTFATGGAVAGPLAYWNYDFSVNLGTSGLHIADVLALSTLTVTDVGQGTTVVVNPFTKWVDNASYDGTTFYQNGAGNLLAAVLLGEENSENLGFGDSPLPAFNRNLNDTYHFVLDVRNAAGTDLSSVAMDVVVGTGVPEPASMTILGMGFVGLVAARRRRKGGANGDSGMMTVAA